VVDKISAIKRNKALFDEISAFSKRFDVHNQDAVVNSIIARDRRVFNFLMTEKNNSKIKSEENLNEENKEDDPSAENI
jgi:hypothetical protein